jgi:Domain of unknown function (DUF5615)
MRTVERLRRLRFAVEAAFEVGISKANDEDVLLYAARRGRLLLTHNYDDFVLLFRAWHRWGETWQVNQSHAGIIICPQPWSPEIAVPRLLTLFDQLESFEDCLIRLLPNDRMRISNASDRSTWQ